MEPYCPLSPPLYLDIIQNPFESQYKCPSMELWLWILRVQLRSYPVVLVFRKDYPAIVATVLEGLHEVRGVVLAITQRCDCTCLSPICVGVAHACGNNSAKEAGEQK